MKWRLLLLSVFVTLYAHSFCQEYTQNWATFTTPRVSGEKLTWTHLRGGRNGDAFTLGIADSGTTRKIILSRVSPTGDLVWFTELPETLTLFRRPLALEIDGADNVYIMFNVDERLIVSSFRATDGGNRWQRQFGTFFVGPPQLAVATRGNSTFVYFSHVEEPGRVTTERLSASNGGQLFEREHGISSFLSINEQAIDANGNLIVELVEGLRETATIIKLSQSLNEVWTTAVPGERFLKDLALHPDSGSILALTTINFRDPQLLLVLNPVNGVIVKQTQPFSSMDRCLPAPAGAFWVLGGTADLYSANLNRVIAPMALSTPVPIQLDEVVADASGALHVPVRRGFFRLQRFPKLAVLEISDVGECHAVFGDSQGNVLAAGSSPATSLGDAIVLQLGQPYSATTDVFGGAFGASFVVDAPGVLANDTNFKGATVQLVAPAASGTVTLALDGGFTYVPGANFSGTDQFRYSLTKGNVVRTATCFVKRVVVSNLALPIEVIGGDTFVGTITLSTGVFSDPLLVNVTTNAPALVGLERPQMSSYDVSRPVHMFTLPVTAARSVTMFAALGLATHSASFRLAPGGLGSIRSVNDRRVIRGERNDFVVSLTGPLEVERSISITYGDATGPTRVTFPAGTTSKTISLFVFATAAAELTITQVLGSQQLRFSFPTFAQPTLDRFEIVPFAYAGTAVRMRATLTGQTGTEIRVVTLSTTSPDFPAFPSFLLVRENGKTSGDKTAVINLVAANTNISITGTLDGLSRTATALVRPNILQTFSVDSSILRLGDSTRGRISLNWFDSLNPTTLTVSSTNTSILVAPAQVTLPPGVGNTEFQISAGTRTGTATIKVSSGQKTITRTITVVP